jgi:O-antigen/teichoic acid export membrane protein
MSQAVFRRRFSQGLLANGFSQVATIAIQVLQLPIIQRLIGDHGLAVWLTMMSLVAFTALAGLSIFVTTGNEMMMSRAKGEDEAAVRSLSSGWAMLLALSLAILGVLAALSPFLDWWSFVQSKSLPPEDLAGFAFWMAVATFFSLQNGMVDAILRAANRYALALSLQTVQRIVETIIGLVCLAVTRNIAAYAFGTAIAKVIGFAGQYAYAMRVAPELRPRRSAIDWAHGRRMLKPSIGHSSIPASFAVELEGYKVALTQGTLNPVSATNFTTMRTLGRMVWQLVYALGNTLWVELSQVLGRGDIERARHLHRKVVRMAVWSSLVAVGVLAVVGRPLYEIWLVRKHEGGEYVFLPDVFALLLAAVFLKSFWSISYMVPISVNRATRIGGWFFAVTLATCFAGYLASREGGLLPAAGVLLLMEFVLIVVVWRETLPMLEEDFLGFLRYVLTPPIGALARALKKIGKPKEVL